MIAAAPGRAFPADNAALTATALGNGVYAVFGSTNEASPENQGRIGNAGFIVGADGTIVINTGSSYRHGRELLETAERVGGKPVVLAVITHRCRYHGQRGLRHDIPSSPTGGARLIGGAARTACATSGAIGSKRSHPRADARAHRVAIHRA